MQETQIKPASLAKMSTIDDEIVIGKDVLELVAGAMYADSLTVYREYIQNAADAVDEARAAGTNYQDDQPHVLISLDHVERTVKIRDLGAGVRNADFQRRLTAIGASGKRGTKQRGFRGVGRLSGLGYCQELIFRSRAKGDAKIKELRWDGRVLREKLRDPGFTDNLADLIREVTQVATFSGDDTYPDHFFEVEMRKVVRIKNDLLMNEAEIRAYLSQVAPVPFHPDFKFCKEIRAELVEVGVTKPIRVELNDDQGIIFHRAVSQVPIGKQATLTFAGIEFKRLTNSAGELLAFGWILEQGYIGAMPRGSNMGGIRLRVRDVQVGDAQILAPLFVEQRFNSWCVGEIHILHPKIVPNGRRDEFEHSAAYAELQDELRRVTNEIAQTIRSRSEERQRSKRLALSIAYAQNWLEVAERSASHMTIRRAALDLAGEHSKAFDKQSGKINVDTASLASAERIRARIGYLRGRLMKKHDTPRSPGTTKSALAAVSAILSSTKHTQQAISMAERVLAAMEGRQKERA
jgi:hypothetical protein